MDVALITARSVAANARTRGASQAAACRGGAARLGRRIRIGADLTRPDTLIAIGEMR